MAKSGRERRAKRKLRKMLEKQVKEKLGDHWVAETPKEQKEQNAIVRQVVRTAIRRWPTDGSADGFDVKDLRSLPARDVALIITHRNMLSPEPMVSNAAVRNLIAMEAQNQKDEFAKEGVGSKHLHLHQHSIDSGGNLMVSIDEIDLSFLSEKDRLELKRRILEKIREKKKEAAELVVG